MYVLKKVQIKLCISFSKDTLEYNDVISKHLFVLFAVVNFYRGFFPNILVHVCYCNLNGYVQKIRLDYGSVSMTNSINKLQGLAHKARTHSCH